MSELAADRKDLFKLLQDLEKQLDYVVTLLSANPTIIPRWLEWDFKKDWIITRRRFDLARETLLQVTDEELNRHGLTGTELGSKISYLNRSAKRVRWQVSRIHWPAPGILRKSLRWFLEVQDNLLESLANVLPPLGAVTELKKQLESSLDIPDVME